MRFIKKKIKEVYYYRMACHCLNMAKKDVRDMDRLLYWTNRFEYYMDRFTELAFAKGS